MKHYEAPKAEILLFRSEPIMDSPNVPPEAQMKEVIDTF